MIAAADWSDFVPVGALVFTVASFWWIYLRRGRLKATPPHVYSSSPLRRRWGSASRS